MQHSDYAFGQVVEDPDKAEPVFDGEQRVLFDRAKLLQYLRWDERQFAAARALEGPVKFPVARKSLPTLWNLAWHHQVVTSDRWVKSEIDQWIVLMKLHVREMQGLLAQVR